MTFEPHEAGAAASGKCPNCGAPAQGKFCNECGAALDESPANAYLLFVDSFFKVGAFRHYVGIYWRILRSPTRATIELFESATLQDALRFL